MGGDQYPYRRRHVPAGSDVSLFGVNISGPANPPGGTLFTNNTEAPFRLPDTWAVGVAYKPNNSWRVGFEYDRVLYGQLAEAFVNNSLPPTWPEAIMLKERLKVDDANQFRLGGEYSASASARGCCRCGRKLDRPLPSAVPGDDRRGQGPAGAAVGHVLPETRRASPCLGRRRIATAGSGGSWISPSITHRTRDDVLLVGDYQVLAIGR